MSQRRNTRSNKAPDLVDVRTADPFPNLIVERGPHGEGVGSWVPGEKHRLLCRYLKATTPAWKKWPSRVYMDPFAGPGRIQVRDESFTRDGGAVVAWRSLAEDAPFRHMFVGDISAERVAACRSRLQAIGAPVTPYVGRATDTVKEMVSAVPRSSLCLAFLDPYNLELLSFAMIQELASLRNVDLLINFSTMDLERNGDLEFDPNRARFDDTAPGWRQDKKILETSRANHTIAFFGYWCQLVMNLGFEYSEQMPLITNNSGRGIYRMVFFVRHSHPKKIWNDIAKGKNRAFNF